MATIIIPAKNFHTALADALEKSQDGDNIVVGSQSQAELARRALARGVLKGKQINIQVRERED